MATAIDKRTANQNLQLLDASEVSRDSIAREDDERQGLLAETQEGDSPQLTAALTCCTMVSDYLTLLRNEPSFASFLLLLCLNGVLYASFLPFLPIFVSAELQLPQSFTGTFRTCSLVLMAATPVMLGVLNCLSPKQSVLIGMLGTTGAGLIFLTATSDSPGTLGVLLVQGAFQGALDGILTAAGKTYMVTVARPAKLGVATALYFIGSTLGSALGSAAGGWVLAESGSSFQLLGLLMSCGSVVLVLSAAVILPGAQQTNKDDSESSDTSSSAAVADVTTSPAVDEGNRGAAFLAIFRRRAVWTLAGWQCLRTVFWGAASLSMPFLLFKQTQSAALVGVFQLVSNLCAMLAMLTFGSISDRGGLQRRRAVAVGSLLALAVCSALLVLAVALESSVALFAVGVCTTAVAWTISGKLRAALYNHVQHARTSHLLESIWNVHDFCGYIHVGQVTPLAKAAAREGQESQLMGIIVSAWAVGALGGAQVHGRLCELDPGMEFVVLTAVMLMALCLGTMTFDGNEGLLKMHGQEKDESS